MIDGRENGAPRWKFSPHRYAVGAVSSMINCELLGKPGLTFLYREWLRMDGGFNRSGQHLLNFLDEEVGHGDVTDSVHGETED